MSTAIRAPFLFIPPHSLYDLKTSMYFLHLQPIESPTYKNSLNFLKTYYILKYLYMIICEIKNISIANLNQIPWIAIKLNTLCSCGQLMIRRNRCSSKILQGSMKNLVSSSMFSLRWAYIDLYSLSTLLSALCSRHSALGILTWQSQNNFAPLRLFWRLCNIPGQRLISILPLICHLCPQDLPQFNGILQRQQQQQQWLPAVVHSETGTRTGAGSERDWTPRLLPNMKQHH